MFEIEASIFREYLNKLTLGGSIPSCILKAGKDGMESTVSTMDNVAIVKATLPRNMFSKYTEDITFPLSSTGDQGDVNLILKLLNRYSGKVIIIKEDNAMRLINGDDEAFITLSSEDFVDNNCKKYPTVNFDSKFAVEKSVLTKTVYNLNAINGKSDTPPVRLKINDNVLTLSVENNQNVLSTKTAVEYKDVNVGICAEYFEKIVQVLGDKVSLSFETDAPVQVTDNSTEITAEYIIAPTIFED